VGCTALLSVVGSTAAASASVTSSAGCAKIAVLEAKIAGIATRGHARNAAAIEKQQGRFQTKLDRLRQRCS
jgi:hypothetical protein